MCDYVIKQRTFEWDIKQYIKVVSLKNNIKLFGSGNISNIVHYKDYDAFETIVYPDMEKAVTVKTFRFGLYGVISRLILQKDVIFSELKCGYDKTFETISKLSEEKKTKECKAAVIFHWKNGHIDLNQYKYMKFILNEKPISFEKFSKFINRYLYTLRWTTNDILDLKKRLGDGSFFTLDKAISQKTLIKMDLIIPVRHVYKELSVIYDVSYITKKGRKIQLTAPMDNDYYVVGIIKDIMYYFDQRNIGKSCKRMYFLCKYLIEIDVNNTKACNMIKSIDRILNSGCGKLDQILDEVEVLLQSVKIIEHLDKKKAIHFPKIIMQIYAIHPRVTDSFDVSDVKTYNLKNKLSESIMAIIKKLFKENLIINNDGDIIYRENELKFIKVLKTSLKELVELLKPNVNSLYLEQLGEMKLNRKAFVKFTKKYL